ncbi:FAD-binding oxidoreductase, partial [Spirochaetota bacterium]
GGGISLDLTRHMNKIIDVNENNSTVTVQPGIFGPQLEDYLNKYKGGYTCGHFPQSFQYSTVGGWTATRGAGTASTEYGKIEDMVLALNIVSPRGEIRTKDYPAAAIGPGIDEIVIGSEGAFGIITEVTLKIRKHRPENASLSSFIFKDFESAVNAMRESIQGEFGKPHLFRISDPEETDIAFKLKGKDKSLSDISLRMLGYKPMKRCLMFAASYGDKDRAKLVSKKIKSIARKHGALSTGAGPTEKWLQQRYSSAYMRDPLMDMGVMADTLETAVTWDNLMKLWNEVRKYIKKRPQTICMTHISHVYENGANLYFTFLSPMKKGKEISDYEKFQHGIINAIHKNSGSLSHHHGIGKMLGPWMNREIGPVGKGLLQSIKDYLDPKGIMNPRGTLGLD